MSTTDKLGEEFWKDIWGKASFTKYYGIEKYLAIHRSMDRLFKKFLVKGDKRLLEIGCARGKQLIYFAEEFGYEVSGLDYSDDGISSAKSNLAKAGIKSTLLCEDIYNTTFEKESFDVVYSAGLVEHFDDVGEIIDIHLGLLKKGGTLVITMPNFYNNFYLWFSRLTRMKRAILATHNIDVMNKSMLAGCISQRNIEILKLGYYGPMDVTISFGAIKHKVMLYFMLLTNQVLGYLTFFMPGSRYFSPYLVLIARKH